MKSERTATSTRPAYRPPSARRAAAPAAGPEPPARRRSSSMTARPVPGGRSSDSGSSRRRPWPPLPDRPGTYAGGHVDFSRGEDVAQDGVHVPDGRRRGLGVAAAHTSALLVVHQAAHGARREAAYHGLRAHLDNVTRHTTLQGNQLGLDGRAHRRQRALPPGGVADAVTRKHGPRKGELELGADGHHVPGAGRVLGESHLVRPVLGVHPRQPGKRLGRHQHQRHVPLHPQPRSVLRLQRAHVVDGKPLPAVDAVQPFRAELDGEDRRRVVARLPPEPTVHAVLGVGDEVVNQNRNVVVEVDGPVQARRLTQGQVPPLRPRQLLYLPPAPPTHDERVRRPGLHLVYHLVELREGARTARGGRPRQHVLAPRNDPQNLVQPVEPLRVHVVHVPVNQLVLYGPHHGLGLHRQHHGPEVLFVRTSQHEEIVQVGVAADNLELGGHRGDGRRRLDPGVGRVVELGRPQGILTIVRQGVTQNRVEGKKGEHRRSVDYLFDHARQKLSPAVLVRLYDRLKRTS